MMARDRAVRASVVLTAPDAVSRPVMVNARMETLAATMHALAAKKGRVLVMPTLRVVEQSLGTTDAMALVARAQTAPKPGWRRRS